MTEEITIKSLSSVYNGDSLELATQLRFASESNRKDSFKRWVFPENKGCCASKLSEAGFYYIGSKNEPDAVQCFLCSKPLDGWEEDDDPWIEHKKHSPECKFVKLGKRECKLTLYEIIDIQMEICRNWVQKLYQIKKHELLNKQKILRKSINLN